MARKACAAVSPPPSSAWCGRCAGRPSAAAIVERLHVPGFGARSALDAQQPPQDRRVHEPARQRAPGLACRNVRSTQLACTTGIRPRICAASGASASGACWSPGEVHLTQAGVYLQGSARWTWPAGARDREPTPTRMIREN